MESVEKKHEKKESVEMARMDLSLSLERQEITGKVFEGSLESIDSIHGDFSDASVETSWRSDCTGSIRYWAEHHPNVPLDLHFYYRDPETLLAKVRELKNIHENVRTVFVHIKSVDDLELMHRLREVHDQIGIALSYSVNQETLKQLRVALQDTGEINDILVSLPKKAEPDTTYQEQALPLLRFLREMYPDVQLGVDRDVHVERLTEAAQAGATQFVVGKALYDAQQKDAVTTAQSLREAFVNAS